MFVSILACALLVVSTSVSAITLPNGFTFDLRQYLELGSRANYALEKCERPTDGCSNDCAAHFTCDGTSNVVEALPCAGAAPYCVKNADSYSMCSSNFPMNNQACLKRATNNFICTEDGQFPDPSDCSKYHVCNGTAHSIVECPANSQFTYDRTIQDVNLNPGNGEFSCRFRPDQESCMCDIFNCEGMANTFIFRAMDYMHYAYCLDIRMYKKVFMFKCPSGTRHNGMTTMMNTVDCTPIVAPIVPIVPTV